MIKQASSNKKYKVKLMKIRTPKKILISKLKKK